MNPRQMILSFVILSLLLLTGCEQATSPLNGTADHPGAFSFDKALIEGNYIVVLAHAAPLDRGLSYEQSSAVVRENAEAVLAAHGVPADAIDLVYSRALTGFSAALSADAARRLADDPRVAFVEQDRIVSGDGDKSGGPVDPEPVPQVMPWGIVRVGGAVEYTGSGVAWILDTGIDLDNADLNVDVARSASFVHGNKDADDDHGHGTHIAGTLAAIDNEIDVVGLAAGATVVPVKVLDHLNRGWITWTVAGLDWVAAYGQPGDVANLSLVALASDALDAAVLTTSELGVFIVICAGNEAADANGYSPARVNGDNIYTVSALDANDIWASFSNFGNPPVDYCAPGVSVISLAMGGGISSWNGTSMATPHVAGLLLSNSGALQTDGVVLGDPDGNPDPIVHR